MRPRRLTGTDQRPGKNLEYGANQWTVEFNEYNQIRKITGVDQARVIDHGDTSETTLTGDRVVKTDFETTNTDSLLQNAVAQGHGTMENKPVLKPAWIKRTPASSKATQSARR